MTPAARRNTLRVLAVLFALFAANDLFQIGDVAMGESDEPLVLVWEHVACAAAGIAAAVGLWRGARWASFAAFAWGLLTAALLVSLSPVLGLPPDSRPGLWRSAVGVVAFAGLVAFLARPRLAPSVDDETSDGPA